MSGSGSIKRRSATKIEFWFWDILDRQANFGRGSRDSGVGLGKRAAPRKKKKYAPPLKKISCRNTMIPRGFLIWRYDKTPGSFGVCSRYISLPNPTTQCRDIKKSEQHGFLYLWTTVNPRDFTFISPMQFDESKDKTQKYDDAKSAHRITSFLLRKIEY